jgi:hypothetical protein
MSKQNNQRSDVKNPNNPAYKADKDNQSNQGNPNHAPTKVGNASPTSTPTPKTEK